MTETIRYTRAQIEELIASGKPLGLRGADLRGIDLSYLNLYGANLYEANLYGANLYGVNLHEANLSRANLYEANLHEANLHEANLHEAILPGVNLHEANLSRANLSRAKLYGANLYEANLHEANLHEANLTGANLSGANLSGAREIPKGAAAALFVPPQTGAFEGWKKARSNYIVHLHVPAQAKRSSATTRKCRVSEAEVLAIYDTAGNHVDGPVPSLYTDSFIYRAGETVRPRDPFDEDRWNECASGIHLFLTRDEAESYF